MVLSLTSFEATNSVFIKTDENNSFSITTPGHWKFEDGEELNNKLGKLLELRSGNDIELHVEEFEERGTRIERKNSGYNLAGSDQLKRELIAEIERVENKDLKDMVY